MQRGEEAAPADTGPHPQAKRQKQNDGYPREIILAPGETGQKEIRTDSRNKTIRRIPGLLVYFGERQILYTVTVIVESEDLEVGGGTEGDIKRNCKEEENEVKRRKRNGNTQVAWMEEVRVNRRRKRSSTGDEGQR